MFKIVISAVVAFFLMMTQAYASVVLGGTRVIYDANSKEASISVRNNDKRPYLIQSWIDNFEGQNQAKLPFVITPPLFRIEPESTNSLRIVYTGKDLPEDRESIFWLNVKSIPPTDPKAKNNLTISINNRIKLIYRPKSLFNSDAENAYKKVTFERNGNMLVGKNPTPYYVSFSDLQVGNKSINEPAMLPPMGEQSWNISGAQGNKVMWKAVSDAGAITDSQEQTLK
ncbi:molecular chaperone [Providencia vermicola]|uniref:Molecular chaperone n=3 Tax=Providencia TaxID=586 RepID=A0AAI9HZY2_PROST|nr:MULTISPECIES: molecular chaperone [Providencia]ELR5035911.1 molecular chaperone [Providencia stuartii]ELR5121954.1 molecular chaperone [Providencia stuartii]ELR5140780.1 molecular chaperone [Providencia stuartii]ELR5290177.1 molecular chaperone [Providencia stuartii]ELX8379435.1 molecular chaperone [Providencia stuartii]